MATSKKFKQLQAELDEILAWFESGEVSVDEAVERYEKAQKLIGQIDAKLKESENKIAKLKQKFSRDK